VSEFNNVTLIKAANIYNEGAVSSRTVLFADGSKKTLGIMMPGEYEFDTADKEIMEILSGKLTVKLPDSEAWLSVQGGELFEVPAHARFAMRVDVITDYCCSYLKS